MSSIPKQIPPATEQISPDVAAEIVSDVSPQSRFLRGRWLALWVALLLGAFAAQAITSMTLKSITCDELHHLSAGYTYLKTGDFRLNAEHPPLAKMISAIPLLFMHIKGAFDSKLWQAGSTWDYGWFFLFESGNDCGTLIFWGRFSMVMLSLFLGLLIFIWARKLYGNAAGVFALFLFAFSPNLIAHGSLTNTDLAITFFLLLALFCFDRALSRLTFRSAVMSGLTLGLALLTKFSAPLALPIMGVAALARIFDRRLLEAGFARTRAMDGWRQKAVALTALFVVIMAIAYAVIWAGYLGRFSARTDGLQHKLLFGGSTFESSQKGVYGFLWKNRLLPQGYIEGLAQVQDKHHRLAFLDGRRNWDPDRPEYTPKWPHYFVMTTLYKTPVPALLFFFIAVVGAYRFSRKTWRQEIVLITAVVLYFAVASFGDMYIGHRHILPVIPPAMIFSSKLAGMLWTSKFRGRAILWGGFTLLVLCYCWSAVKIHPNYLAYFNEIAGGPERGAEHLMDSNIDWGQDLILLKKYMDENRIENVHLIYFGSGDPRYYGVRCKFFFPPSWSANVLNSIPSSDLSSAGGVAVGDYFAISVTRFLEMWRSREEHDLLDKFRALQPVAKIGYSIYIYRSPFALGSLDIKEIDRIRAFDRYMTTATEISLLEKGRQLESEYAEIPSSYVKLPGKQGYDLGAITYYQRSLESMCNYADIHNNFGIILEKRGQIEAAAAHYRKAIEIKPDLIGAYNNLGNLLLRQGQMNAAVAYYQKALEIAPHSALTYFNLGIASAAGGEIEVAVTRFQKALEIKPEYADAHNNLGIAQASLGRIDAAIFHFRKAIEIKPDYAEAHNNLGSALMERGQFDSALAHFQKALEIQPNNVEVRVNLGQALDRQGKTTDAVFQWREVLRLQPDDVTVLNQLARTLATCPEAAIRNGSEAVALAMYAVNLSGGQDPSILDTLAAAYAEAGRFAEAVNTALRAVSLESSRGNTEMEAAIRARIDLYKMRSPYREPRP